MTSGSLGRGSPRKQSLHSVKHQSLGYTVLQTPRVALKPFVKTVTVLSGDLSCRFSVDLPYLSTCHTAENRQNQSFLSNCTCHPHSSYCKTQTLIVTYWAPLDQVPTYSNESLSCHSPPATLDYSLFHPILQACSCYWTSSWLGLPTWHASR